MHHSEKDRSTPQNSDNNTGTKDAVIKSGIFLIQKYKIPQPKPDPLKFHLGT
jgi:hypothetical protein